MFLLLRITEGKICFYSCADALFETILKERNEIPQFFSQLIITAIRQVSITRPVHGYELGVEIQSCAIYEAEGIKRDPAG